MQNIRKNLAPIFLMISVLLVFGAGFWVGRANVVCRVCQPENVNFSLFWETWETLQKYYVDPAKFNAQDMIYGAISGMVNSLNDPYTVFFNPNDTKKFLEDVGGRFEGIGIEIGIKNGQLQVVAPLEGTPAKQAGLRPGDRILKIDATDSSSISTEEAVSLIRGPKGTDVVLTIFREGWNSPQEIKIQRAVIEIPSLKLDFFASGDGKPSADGDIAYLRIYQFSENLSSDFSKTAVRIFNSNAKKIILDLRDNPGGYLEVSQDIAGWFLERDKTVVIEDFGRGLEQSKYETDGNSSLLNYPMVILLNAGSASAAEILAAAFKDNRDIQIIGEKSFGKGSVQELKDLSDGSTVKITIARWLTPKGNLIEGKGIDPDIKVELTEQDAKDGKDPQLDKAIEIIKGLR